MKKIAIMTAGGDCAGLNSAIKSIVMAASIQQIEVIGVMDGYIGFVEGRYIPLNADVVRSIETKGGTMLGSSNKECPFHYYNKETGEFEDRVDEGRRRRYGNNRWRWYIRLCQSNLRTRNANSWNSKDYR